MDRILECFIIIILIRYIPPIFIKRYERKRHDKIEKEIQKYEKNLDAYNAELKEILFAREHTSKERKNIYRELRKKYDRERKYFVMKPLMADVYEQVLPLGKVLIFSLIPLSIIIVFFCNIDYYGFWGSVEWMIDAVKEMTYQDVIFMLMCLGFLCVLGCLCTFLQKYMEYTECIYGETGVTIKRYLRPDKSVEYSEIAECIKQRKILVREGRFELPYKGGRIYVYCLGTPPREKFYEFLNQKCGIKMPTVNFNVEVCRTGLGLAFGKITGGFLLVLLTSIGFIACLGDNQMDIRLATAQLLTKYYGIFIPGLLFIVLGVILKVIFAFPARKKFESYKNIIKVTWW